MKTAAILILAVILLICGVSIVRGLFAGAGYALSAAAAEARSGAFTTGVADPHALGPYTIHGTAIMDASAGTPAVPYLRYTDAKGRVATKQLVYTDARACAPGAGDFPCVSPYSASDGYPELSTGDAITVTGYLYENRFLVSSISTGA